MSYRQPPSVNVSLILSPGFCPHLLFCILSLPLTVLVGELPEEEENPEIVKRDDNSWLMDGLLSIEEFK